MHTAVGIEAEGDKIELLIKELDGKDVNEVIAEGALPRHCHGSKSVGSTESECHL